MPVHHSVILSRLYNHSLRCKQTKNCDITTKNRIARQCFSLHCGDAVSQYYVLPLPTKHNLLIIKHFCQHQNGAYRVGDVRADGDNGVQQCQFVLQQGSHCER